MSHVSTTPPCPPQRTTRATSTFAAIDPARCTGCGWCLSTCPDQLLAFATSGWRKHTVLLSREACDGCGKCAAKCPMGAIRMRRQSDAQTPAPKSNQPG